MPETLKELGEFGLIRKIREILENEGTANPAALTVGVGDDSAAFKPRPGHEILITCDSVVEGRHYLPEYVGPRDVGRRAMVVNISDIGAMGGRPLYAIVSLGLRGETPVGHVEEMYRGFLEELNPFGACIIGGNICGGVKDAFVDVTLVGEVREGSAVRRSGAMPGDAILVTGSPGEAAAGMQLLLHGLATADHHFVTAYTRPRHRAREGAAAAESGLATSMIDTSDGFIGDLGHICEESGVGAELFKGKLPVSKTLQDSAALLEKDPHEFFFGASDDYELIITCAPEHLEEIRASVSAIHAAPVSEVGRITEPGRGVRLLLPDGSEQSLYAEGWDHFR